MKKILLLGGSRYLLPVIQSAHEMGYYAITCDYLPDNFAHGFSDEYHNVSILDMDGILDLARKLRIDGIMSFACDPGVKTAAYVADRMGLPSCGPYESVSILQNKGDFRLFLTEHGFNVPRARSYTDVEEALHDVDFFNWPVIVKPTDSAGSKGVCRIEHPDHLRAAVENALSFSHCSEFIIEDFIPQLGYSSDSDCFSVDGELVFASFSSQRFDSCAQNPYTPAAYSWPASMSMDAQFELRNEIQRLLGLLGMGTSLYNVETRVSLTGKPYIMEVSPRGGGNRISEILGMSTGMDLIGNAVRAAMGESVSDITGDPVYSGHWAMIALHANLEGFFKTLWIDPWVEEKFVVEKDLWVRPGEMVHGFTGANETIGTLILHFDTEDQLELILSEQSRFFKIIL